MPGGKPDEDDIREHRRLDPERATRVGRGQQAKPVALQSERGRSDAVQRERPLEVRPCGEPFVSRIPVGDDREALDRGAREARHVERVSQHEIGRRHCLIDVAVRKAPVVHRIGDCRVEHRVERVVVDLDEFGCILGEIAVARHDDGDRLADVADGVNRCRVLGRTAVDPRRERSR